MQPIRFGNSSKNFKKSNKFVTFPEIKTHPINLLMRYNLKQWYLNIIQYHLSLKRALKKNQNNYKKVWQINHGWTILLFDTYSTKEALKLYVRIIR